MPSQIPSILSRSGLQEALPVVVVDRDGNLGSVRISPLGYRQMQIAVGSASVIDDIPAGTKVVLVKIEGGSVRYRDDGVAPTAQVGMPLADGEAMTYDAEIEGIQLIAQSDACICNMAFYGDQNG